MIMTQTPLRISFLGGGTDYLDYFKRYGGATLATSIDKYTIITVHHLTKFSDCRFRIHYSRIESVNHIDEIQHPSARECLRFLNIDGGIEIHYISDLPAKTGLGASSSATVGLLMALHAFKGEMVSKNQVAREAIHVEQELIKEHVGCQDQYICALGGFLHLKFQSNGNISYDYIVIPQKRLKVFESNLLLLYTGIQRYAHEVLNEQIERTRAGENIEELQSLKTLVEQGIDILTGNHELSKFGALLHEGWMLKRCLSSKVSNSWIDEIYNRARKAGAVGGKILGAGGGGFLLLYVEHEERNRVKQSLPELQEVKFTFEDIGTRIIFYRS